MTIAAGAAAMPSVDGVHWRALASGVWVARRDGRHIGTVQKGRRWLATGVDGEPIGSFRSFREAQTAVADPGAQRSPLAGESALGSDVGRAARHKSTTRSASQAPATRGSIAPALAVAALGAAALASVAGWVWTAFLL